MKPHVYLSCLLALQFGCANRTGSSDEPEHGHSSAYNRGEAPEKKTEIVIAPEVVKMCDIPTAHFDFDSSDPSLNAERALNDLTDCFLDGPASDEELRLVGYADPRGTEDYNLVVGQRRANHVASYLERRGLDEDRIEIASQGESKASGIDEYGWEHDRRVEVFLARR